jgi:short-subunit dehydrogenase
MTFITGASSGIGRSLARRIAADGEPVTLVARRADLLESLATEIVRAGGRALAIPCDVTHRDEVHDAVRRAEAELGPITTLIANAGAAAVTRVDGFDAAHVAGQLELNVMGAVHCIEAVLPGMLARRAGHIVATGSLAGSRGLPGSAAYSASKAALRVLLEGLAVDLHGRGVDITVLAPGFVRTKSRGGHRRANRPFRMDLEDATARMHRAIRARRRSYQFPASLVVLVHAARMLPTGVYNRLLAGRGPDAKGRAG